MGLTSKSTGTNAIDNGLLIEKTDGDRVIALAGNPNVGKSTVFNTLTGLNQHTGNWPGKTVSNAQGKCVFNDKSYILVDIPGTYSLMAHSAEEEVARDFICFGGADAVIVVCDATCLERNLNLVLQTIEITSNVVVCVNLLDEAKKKKIFVDLEGLEQRLGVAVVGAVARSEKGLDRLMERLEKVCDKSGNKAIEISYSNEIEKAIEILLPSVAEKLCGKLNPRWVAIKLLDRNTVLLNSLNEFLGFDILDGDVKEKLSEAESLLEESGVEPVKLRDTTISSIIKTAEKIASEVVTFEKDDYYERDRKLDRILTNRIFGVPIMILLLGVIFWITITGANYPSQVLSAGLFWVGDRLHDFFDYVNAPMWLSGIIVDGIYRVLAWVVSVMLPPMAIFFPLFTLLEDLGYLPRVAFNLDKHFKKACACGKQALTMCMGNIIL